jgi:hypothetical protein
MQTSQNDVCATPAIVRNHMPARQDRSAQSDSNPANLKDLLWPHVARHSSLVTVLNRCTAADGCPEQPLLAVILHEGNAWLSGRRSRSAQAGG